MGENHQVLSVSIVLVEISFYYKLYFKYNFWCTGKCLSLDQNFVWLQNIILVFLFSYCKFYALFVFHKLFHKSAIIFLEFIFWGFFENEFLLVHSQKTVLENFSELVVPKKWFVIKSLKKGMQLSAHISNSGHYLTVGNDLLLVLNMLWHIVLLFMLHSFISSFKKNSCFNPCFSPFTIFWWEKTVDFEVLNFKGNPNY